MFPPLAAAAAAPGDESRVPPWDLGRKAAGSSGRRRCCGLEQRWKDVVKKTRQMDQSWRQSRDL